MKNWITAITTCVSEHAEIAKWSQTLLTTSSTDEGNIKRESDRRSSAGGRKKWTTRRSMELRTMPSFCTSSAPRRSQVLVKHLKSKPFQMIFLHVVRGAFWHVSELNLDVYALSESSFPTLRNSWVLKKRNFILKLPSYKHSLSVLQGPGGL